jgi:hypothetical protein
VFLDRLAFRGDRIHHFGAGATRRFRNAEHVDDCVFQGEIDDVLEPPAHGGFEFRGQDVRGFDQHQLIIRHIQYRADRAELAAVGREP